MAKLPSMQFYPGDWMKDPAVRSCSYAAKGLWIDMLCLMWESPERGVLRSSTHAAIGAKQISNCTGGNLKEVTRLLQELQDNGVFSTDSNGYIYSRRMVRDEALTKVRREAGTMGGNPVLLKQATTKRPDLLKQNTTTPVNQITTPSSSSSSSSLKHSLEGFTNASFNGNEDEPIYWSERLYARHPKKKDRVQVEQLLSQIFWDVGGREAFIDIDKRHEIQCKSADWTKESGKWVPSLCKWLSDRAWTGVKLTPPQSSTPIFDPIRDRE